MEKNLKSRPRSSWKTQHQKIENTSALHEKVRQIFCSDRFWSHLRCFQEVFVSDLVEDYPFTQHRIDWYIHELATVLELHGVQHYKVSNFGGLSAIEAEQNYIEGRFRDTEKQVAIENAGYSYRCISYKDLKNITPQFLKNVIL